MRKSNPKIYYLGIFFFVLMLFNIIYASVSDMSGIHINGEQIDLPVELLILNAFMFGFILNVISSQIGKLWKKGK